MQLVHHESNVYHLDLSLISTRPYKDKFSEACLEFSFAFLSPPWFLVALGGLGNCSAAADFLCFSLKGQGMHSLWEGERKQERQDGRGGRK